MRRCRQVRITHAEVDDIGARIARDSLGTVDLLEHVGWQTADAMKFFHGFGLWSCATSQTGRRRTLYHGLGAAPAADTLALGSAFFFLAAGSATFFFAGCSEAWPSRVVRSRDAVNSSFSFLRSASSSSPSARGAGLS